MDYALEASPQRLRHHLRRPLAGSRDLLAATAETPITTQTLADLHVALFG